MKTAPLIYVILSLPLLLTGCDGMNKEPTYTGAASDTPPSSTNVPADSILEQQVNTAIQRDPLFRNGDVSVSVMESTVRLSGRVATPEHIAKAEEIARNIQGVKAVSNDLVLSGAGTSY